MLIRKILLDGTPVVEHNVRLPVIARLDGDGQPAIWFMEDETSLQAVKRKIIVQSTGAPFPNEAIMFLAWMGMFVMPSCEPLDGAEVGTPAIEHHVFVDQSSNVIISNDGSIILPR